jgi:hypothetical protein
LEREVAEKNKRLKQKQLLKDGLNEQIIHKVIPNKGALPNGGMSEEERRLNQANIQKLYNQFSQEYGADPELSYIINQF